MPDSPATAPLPAEVTSKIQAGAFLLVDKPRGPSSHQVTAWVRDLLRVKLAGHAGTLDPHVSGLLWVGVGPSLKLLPLMLEFPKRYVGVVTFHASVGRPQLEQVVREFTGPIFQIPPVRSAVKRRRRIRTIHRLNLLEYDPPNALLDAVVDSGTYIRSLAVDLGDALGVGGHLAELRRTGTGPFTESASVTLSDLSDAVAEADAGRPAGLLAMLHPMAEVWGQFPKIRLKSAAAAAIAHGAPLARGGILSVEGRFVKDGSVALVTEQGEIVAVGHALRDSEHLGGPGWVVDGTRVLADRARFAPIWRRSARSPSASHPGSAPPAERGA